MYKMKYRIVAFALIFLCLFSPAEALGNITYNDELIPEVIKSVSPCVVGIIGNLKDELITAESKYDEQIVHGTGVIIKTDGVILTNAHVVKDMDRIVIVLSDGSGYEGSLQCMDEESDLATVKISKKGLPVAKFAKEENIIIGKTVIAIGTPISFSLRNSASLGIISNVNKGVDSYYRLLQTDAAINPGNSGGPLVNLKGEIVGINSSKFMGLGIEGMGFSIPVNTVKYVVNQFEKYNMVKRPSLGVEFEEDWAARVGLPSNNGLKIISVDDSKSMLKDGDTLISINESKVNSIIDLNEEMKKYLPGSNVKITIKRGGKLQSTKVILLSDKKQQ